MGKQIIKPYHVKILLLKYYILIIKIILLKYQNHIEKQVKINYQEKMCHKN